LLSTSQAKTTRMIPAPAKSLKRLLLRPVGVGGWEMDIYVCLFSLFQASFDGLIFAYGLAQCLQDLAVDPAAHVQFIHRPFRWLPRLLP
jgi:hypothetical protein